jgi:D-lyxose ketol-isomerase
MLTRLAGVVLCALVFVSLNCGEPKGAVMVPKNSDFYDGKGEFQADKAKAAYFDMMTRFHYPIPESLRKGMWVADFKLGDFAHVGMAGIFWHNDKETGVFGHEIFLLPGQMIVEHGHETAGDAKAKMEAWHVRHGSIYSLGEGTPDKPLPIQLPESQAKYITVKNWKIVQEGEIDWLKRPTARHFMIAGPQGAIVTEYGTYHTNDGLRFTNPGVKF